MAFLIFVEGKRYQFYSRNSIIASPLTFGASVREQLPYEVSSIVGLQDGALSMTVVYYWVAV